MLTPRGTLGMIIYDGTTCCAGRCDGGKKTIKAEKICRSVVYNIAVTACAACVHVRFSQRVVTYSAVVGRLKQIAPSKKFKLQQSGFLRKINPLWSLSIRIYVALLCTGIVIIPLHK